MMERCKTEPKVPLVVEVAQRVVGQKCKDSSIKRNSGFGERICHMVKDLNYAHCHSVTAPPYVLQARAFLVHSTDLAF